MFVRSFLDLNPEIHRRKIDLVTATEEMHQHHQLLEKHQHQVAQTI